jgi:Uma2 family endonuclease
VETLRQTSCTGTSRGQQNEVFMADRARIVAFDDGRICDMAGKWTATVEDLRRTDAKKAELVDGYLVVMPLGGGIHGYAAGEILVSLHDYARRTGAGYALPDGVFYLVNLPNRRSFCPDVALSRGPLTEDLIDGAPIFAVEVRSKEDFGPVAELRLARKRADYFAAGTLVVWDVDPLRDRVVRAYRASDLASAVVFSCGQMADAEPALPGWSMPVDDLFPN